MGPAAQPTYRTRRRPRRPQGRHGQHHSSRMEERRTFERGRILHQELMNCWSSASRCASLSARRARSRSAATSAGIDPFAGSFMASPKDKKRAKRYRLTVSNSSKMGLYLCECRISYLRYFHLLLSLDLAGAILGWMGVQPDRRHRRVSPARNGMTAFSSSPMWSGIRYGSRRKVTRESLTGSR